MSSETPQKFIVGIGTLLVTVLIQGGLVQAQTAPTNAQTSSTTNVQKHIIQLPAARLRTAEDMERDSAKVINPIPQAIPFRPTIDPETYQKLKDQGTSQRVLPVSKPSPDSGSNRDLTR